jgi:uncharacterized protein YutD
MSLHLSLQTEQHNCDMGNLPQQVSYIVNKYYQQLYLQHLFLNETYKIIVVKSLHIHLRENKMCNFACSTYSLKTNSQHV